MQPEKHDDLCDPQSAERLYQAVSVDRQTPTEPPESTDGSRMSILSSIGAMTIIVTKQEE